jgi:transposase-like protein
MPMDDHGFVALLGQVGALSLSQREALLRVLSSPAPSPGALLDSGGPDLVQCPHCDGAQVSKWGTAHGLQRYRCRGCRRSFNALTGTPLARLRHKSVWLGFASALQQTLSVRKSAKACGVAVSTAFRWRHRFLATPTASKPVQMSGIVEADETFFRRSYKGLRRWTAPDTAAPDTGAPGRAPRRRGAPTGRRGTPLDEQVPVLIVRDRQKTTSDAVLNNLTAKAIGTHLVPLLAQDALLCTDTASAYGVIARQAGIRHEPLNISAGERVRDKVFHIQNVNAYDSRLKAWMRPFNGVATRYLHNYLGWRRMIENLAETINPTAILIKCARAA